MKKIAYIALGLTASFVVSGTALAAGSQIEGYQLRAEVEADRMQFENCMDRLNDGTATLQQCMPQWAPAVTEAPATTTTTTTVAPVTTTPPTTTVPAPQITEEEIVAVLTASYSFDERSSAVTALQEILGVSADGHYGNQTRNAHIAELNARGMDTAHVPSVPTTTTAAPTTTVPPAPTTTVPSGLHPQTVACLAEGISCIEDVATTYGLEAGVFNHRWEHPEIEVSMSGSGFIADCLDSACSVVRGVMSYALGDVWEPGIFVPRTVGQWTDALWSEYANLKCTGIGGNITSIGWDGANRVINCFVPTENGNVTYTTTSEGKLRFTGEMVDLFYPPCGYATWTDYVIGEDANIWTWDGCR